MESMSGKDSIKQLGGVSTPLHLVHVHGQSLDRWFPYDRYLRRTLRAVKKAVSPRPESTGTRRWVWHLKEGLDILDVAYDTNNFRALKKNPGRVACVLGNVNALKYVPKENPVLFGPRVPSHPNDFDWSSYPNIRAILVSCDWLADAYRSKVSLPVHVWPAGIPTDRWSPRKKQREIIVYDKIRWDREDYEHLVQKAKSLVRNSDFALTTFRHGHYLEENFKSAVERAQGMIFLCESETQGFAYLQTLSCDTPILAWEDPTPWRDPSYFPHIKIKEATSTPYWSSACGEKFNDVSDLASLYDVFTHRIRKDYYNSRQYIKENLSIPSQSLKYFNIAKGIS